MCRRKCPLLFSEGFGKSKRILLGMSESYLERLKGLCEFDCLERNAKFQQMCRRKENLTLNVSKGKESYLECLEGKGILL